MKIHDKKVKVVIEVMPLLTFSKARGIKILDKVTNRRIKGENVKNFSTPG